MRAKRNVTTARHIVLRDADGLNTPYVLAYAVPTVRCPTIDAKGGFGCVDYVWDGSETNVMGQPVYRCGMMPPWRAWKQ